MSHSHSTVGAAVAALVVLAVGALVVLRPLAGTKTFLQAALVFDPVPLGLVETIQRIDQILETVLDLVQTISRLFGEGAEGAEGAAEG